MNKILCIPVDFHDVFFFSKSRNNGGLVMHSTSAVKNCWGGGASRNFLEIPSSPQSCKLVGGHPVLWSKKKQVTLLPLLHTPLFVCLPPSCCGGGGGGGGCEFDPFLVTLSIRN